MISCVLGCSIVTVISYVSNQLIVFASNCQGMQTTPVSPQPPISQNFTRFVSVCSNTANDGQEDGLSGSLDIVTAVGKFAAMFQALQIGRAPCV